MKWSSLLIYAIIPTMLGCPILYLSYFAYTKSPGNFFLPPNIQEALNAHPARETETVERKDDPPRTITYSDMQASLSTPGLNLPKCTAPASEVAATSLVATP